MIQLLLIDLCLFVCLVVTAAYPLLTPEAIWKALFSDMSNLTTAAQNTAANNRTSLLDLPAKIIELTGYFVPRRQVATPRRVSREIEKSTRGVFKNVNYRVLTASLASERSLERCLEIAQRPEYAITIRRFDIFIDQYDDNKGWKDRENDELEMKRTHLDKKLLFKIFRQLRQHAKGTTVQIRSGSGLGPRFCGASLGSRFNTRGLYAPPITDGRPFRTVTAALTLSGCNIDSFVLDSFDEEAYSVAVHRVVMGPPNSCPALANAAAVFQHVRELRIAVWARAGDASDAIRLIQTVADSPYLKVLAVRSRDRFDDRIGQPSYISDYAVGKAICSLRFPKVRRMEIQAMLVLKDLVVFLRRYDRMDVLVLEQVTIDVDGFDPSVTWQTNVITALNALAPSRQILIDANTRVLGEYEEDEEIRYTKSF